MARLAEQGGVRHQMTDMAAAAAGCLTELQGLQGLQGMGSGYVLETLAAGRKGQEELAGAVREVRGGVEDVRNKVDRLLERAETRGRMIKP